MLGEILVEAGVTSQNQIDSATETASATGKKLGEVLIEEGAVTEAQVASSLASQYGVEYVDLGTPEGSERVQMDLIDGDLVRKHLILPLDESNGRIRLLVHDPSDLGLIDTLTFRLGKDIDLAIGVRSQIKDFIEEMGGTIKRVITADDLTIDKSDDRSVDREASIDSIDV